MQVMTFTRFRITDILDICFFKKAMNDKFILKKSFSDRKIVALNHLLVPSPYIHLQDSSCLEKNKEKRRLKMKAKRYFYLFIIQLRYNLVWLNRGKSR